MRIIFTFLVFLPTSCFAEVLTIDFVKVLNGNDEEAVFYYEHNWKRHRIEAAKRGYISSYELLVRTSGEGPAGILLITRYASEQDYDNREKNFRVVMQSTSGDGPLLMTDMPPSEFREVVDTGVFTND
jgi:hypothetical protein